MSVTGAGRSADLIVINGRVLTMDDDNPAAEAVAIKDGAILAIGSRAAIEELKGPGTKVIDAEGGSVIPGFIEAHMHLFRARPSLPICSCRASTGSRRCKRRSATMHRHGRMRKCWSGRASTTPCSAASG